MTGKAFVCKLKGLAPIEGADKIVQANMYGETVIVSSDSAEGTIGLLFDCETRLESEFASRNNLYRHSELNSDQTKKGYFEDVARVKPVKMRGVKCSAFWMPLSSLPDNGEGLFEGEYIDTYKGIKICSRNFKEVKPVSGALQKSPKLVPDFREHFDTPQALRSLGEFNPGDRLIITEKVHGTSCRYGKMLVDKPLSFWERFKTGFSQSTRKELVNVVGSRRVIKSIDSVVHKSGGFHDDNLYETVCAQVFGNRLLPGETIYFEIVGRDPNTNAAIMPGQTSSKLKSFLTKEEYKSFVNIYGDRVSFDYGCDSHQYKVFVYRITTTFPGSEPIDYSWKQVLARCEELTVSPVNTLAIYQFDDTDKLSEDLENMASGRSIDHPNTLREGVCVRVENGGRTPKIYKHKSFTFKVLEGIIKESQEGPIIN